MPGYALTGAALVVLYAMSLAVPANDAAAGESTERGVLRGASRKTAHRPGEIAVASWYGAGHQGRITASGEPFDKNRATAAHRTLPLGSLVRVTNLHDGRSVVVRITDRGPYVKGRAIDLSESAAERIGIKAKGVSPVRIEPVRIKPVRVTSPARSRRDVASSH